MNSEIKKVCEQIAELPDEDCATQLVRHPILRGELGIDDLKALADYALRVEKMLEAAVFVAFENGRAIRRVLNAWHFIDDEQPFHPTTFPNTLSAFEAQDVSNGRGTAERAIDSVLQ